MFNKISKTYAGAVVALIGYIAVNFGIAEQGEWTEVVALIAQAVGIVGVMWDRLSKKDINVSGIRK